MTSVVYPLALWGCQSYTTENEIPNNVPVITVTPPASSAAQSTRESRLKEFLASAEYAKASPAMQAATRYLFAKGLPINPHDLPECQYDPLGDLNSESGDSKFEVLRLPEPYPITHDGFRYSLVLDQTRQLAWVRVVGGVAGITYFRGPIKIAQNTNGVFTVAPFEGAKDAK